LTFLLLSIICSTAIALLFKVFAIRKLDIFQVIISNYYCAAACGLLLQKNYTLATITESSWLWVALILGVLFISGFYSMGMTVKHFGVSLGMMSSKMSIIISVTAALFLFSDVLTVWKIVGIILILVSIYMVSRRDEVKDAPFKFLLFPIYLWLASGCIEILLKMAENTYLPSVEINIFNSSIFATAGTIGSIVFVGLLSLKKITFSLKSWLAGIGLGVVNYFSIFYTLKTLELPEFPASIFYPINNVAVICLSILLAWLLLSEKLSKLNVSGILLAIIGICIISFYG